MLPPPFFASLLLLFPGFKVKLHHLEEEMSSSLFFQKFQLIFITLYKYLGIWYKHPSSRITSCDNNVMLDQKTSHWQGGKSANITAGRGCSDQSEVAEGLAVRPQVEAPLVGGISAGTAAEGIPGGCLNVGSPTDGYEPGNEGAGIGDTPLPGPEAEERRELAISSF